MDDSVKSGVMKMMECYKVCTKTINHCLEMGGEHASPQHINLLMDCAKMCQTAADFAIRQSENHPAVCGVCADIYEQCADQCEEMAGDDEEMKKCAQVCRECAEECRKMAAR
jgi:hypothetical protein